MRSTRRPVVFLWLRAAAALALVLSTPLTAAWAGQADGPSLSIERAVRAALDNRGELDALQAAVESRDGIVLQSGFRPNPRLTLQTENWRFSSGFDASQELDLFAFVSQPFETAGKRALRVEAAERGRRIAEAERDAFRWTLGQQVKAAFLRALLAQQEVELLRENQVQFRQITDYHRARVEQGAIPEVDLIRVDLERERSELALQGAEMVAEQALLELFRLMGSPPPDPLPRLDDLSPDPPPATPGLTRAALMQRAKATRWEAILAGAELERARTVGRLERARARPDWDLSLGYKRTAGFNSLLAGVTIPLPLLDSNQGNILSTAKDVEAAEFRLAAVLRRIEGETEEALAAWLKRAEMLDRLRGGMLERAEESFEIALAAYQEGASDLLRLLDSRRALNDVRLLFARGRIELELSRVQLQSAVGAEDVVPGKEMSKP